MTQRLTDQQLDLVDGGIQHEELDDALWWLGCEREHHTPALNVTQGLRLKAIRFAWRCVADLPQILVELRASRARIQYYVSLCEDAAQFMYRAGFVAGTPDEELHGALIVGGGKHPMDWRPTPTLKTARELMEASPEVRDRYMREAAERAAPDYEPGGPLHGI